MYLKSYTLCYSHDNDLLARDNKRDGDYAEINYYQTIARLGAFTPEEFVVMQHLFCLHLSIVRFSHYENAQKCGKEF